MKRMKLVLARMVDCGRHGYSKKLFWSEHGWLNLGRWIPAIAGVFKGGDWHRQVPLVEMNPWICSLVDFEHVEKSNHLEKKGLTWSTR
jgi:hypothetical protein